MSKTIIGLCTFLLFAVSAFGQTPPASSEIVAEANHLISRVVHQTSDQFVCEVIPSDNNRDVFEIDTCGGKIVLRGNNGVSLASAFNWYLKYYALCDYSQCGSRLKLPFKLPLPTRKIRTNATVPYRYMYNYCTYGYTMPWWNWEQWEKEIDWMPMNGINLPFIVVGQEAVWVNTFIQLRIYGKRDQGMVG